MNEQNLKPRELSTEEAKRIGSIGGKASVKARRERKTIAECLNAYLDGQTVEGVTRRELLAMSAIKRATEEGRVTDLKVIAELVGELKTAIVDAGGLTIVVKNPEEAKMIEDLKNMDV